VRLLIACLFKELSRILHYVY
jgi:hypothetical protein